jgi:hypothetical protein
MESQIFLRWMRAPCEHLETLIPRGARNCLCVRSGANLLQPVTKVSGIDPRRGTYGSIIVVVMKQKLFGFALPANRAADPILDGASEHGAPKFLLGDFLILVAMN